MKRYLLAVMVVVALPIAGWGQDSGPGPVAPATLQQYDVSLYHWFTRNDAVFSFLAPEDASSPWTTGAMEAEIGGEILSGDWQAFDFGTYAFWMGSARTEANVLFALGWSTPEFILGHAFATTSETSPGRLRAHFLFGEAIAAEPPPAGDNGGEGAPDAGGDPPTDDETATGGN
jgi:hypothetical protein